MLPLVLSSLHFGGSVLLYLRSPGVAVARYRMICLVLNQHFQLATYFDDMNKEFFLYALSINETLFSKLF